MDMIVHNDGVSLADMTEERDGFLKSEGEKAVFFDDEQDEKDVFQKQGGVYLDDFDIVANKDVSYEDRLNVVPPVHTFPMALDEETRRNSQYQNYNGNVIYQDENGNVIPANSSGRKIFRNKRNENTPFLFADHERKQLIDGDIRESIDASNLVNKKHSKIIKRMRFASLNPEEQKIIMSSINHSKFPNINEDDYVLLITTEPALIDQESKSATCVVFVQCSDAVRKNRKSKGIGDKHLRESKFIVIGGLDNDRAVLTSDLKGAKELAGVSHSKVNAGALKGKAKKLGDTLLMANYRVVVLTKEITKDIPNKKLVEEFKREQTKSFKLK